MMKVLEMTGADGGSGDDALRREECEQGIKEYGSCLLHLP